MGLIGSIAGGALGAAGSIFGGISASKAMRRVKKNLQAQKEANQNWYDRRYNEDATQRADAQRILTQTEESIRNRNRQAAGAQAVMGGTDESTAAAKAANAQALADATSQIAVNAENRKDQIEQTYQQRDSQINEALNNLEINKAQAISQAVQGVAKAGAGIAGAF
ncbi:MULTISPECIES: hypothetical protein [Prevotellaceae]|jgi:hypothetical protein|uniref:hypothetical protein n=1 Tax=Prevotellaceae TaxID=171552 RepID=UPI001C2C39AB|nr:hypothetical protein [Leyella stercorea]MBD9036483.1 hypothetical protein [Prevotella sp.]MBU9897650.1 hypothetical protein [Leyella stercorea]MBU9946233.1 hypothetical protein [Leyella stercorea]DAW50710.1 MAG TPA: YopD protein [Caudoviricetes sp.]